MGSCVDARGLDQPFYFPSQATISKIACLILQRRQASCFPRPKGYKPPVAVSRSMCDMIGGCSRFGVRAKEVKTDFSQPDLEQF